MITLKIIITNIKCSLSAWPQISSDNSLSALPQISSDNRPEVENNGTIRRVAGWDSQSPSPYPFMAVARSKPYTLFYVL